MDHPCIIHGLPMDNPWITHGYPIDNPWIILIRTESIRAQRTLSSRPQALSVRGLGSLPKLVIKSRLSEVSENHPRENHALNAGIIKIRLLSITFVFTIG